MFLGRFGLFRFVYLVLRIHRVIPAYLESLAQGWVPRNLWKCSGKYFEISWVCHLDRLMNEVRGLRPLQRMKTIFKWEFWVDHLVYKCEAAEKDGKVRRKENISTQAATKAESIAPIATIAACKHMNLYESVWSMNWIELSHTESEFPTMSQMFPALPTGQWSWRSDTQFCNANSRNSAQICALGLFRLQYLQWFWFSCFFESQPSEPRIFEGFFRLFFSCSISSAGPFSGLVKMGLLKEQEIPYLADRAQRLDMKYTQEILSVPFWMDLDLQTRVEEQSKVRLWGIDRRH